MTPRLMLLVSLRAQVDALIAMEEAETGFSSAPDECQHPEDKRVNATAMGGGTPQFWCQDCKQFVTQP